jgi:hypothetical protein
MRRGQSVIAGLYKTKEPVKSKTLNMGVGAGGRNDPSLVCTYE